MSSDLLHARPWLIAQLAELLPDGWDIKPGLAVAGKIARPTLYVDYGRIEFDPSLAMGLVRCVFTLTLADFHEDLAKSEDAVDEEFIYLCSAIDQHQNIAPGVAATKNQIEGSSNLGWQLDVSILARKLTDPTPDPTPDEE